MWPEFDSLWVHLGVEFVVGLGIALRVFLRVPLFLPPLRPRLVASSLNIAISLSFIFCSFRILHSHQKRILILSHKCHHLVPLD